MTISFLAAAASACQEVVELYRPTSTQQKLRMTRRCGRLRELPKKVLKAESKALLFALQIEKQFAVVCFEQAEAYWNLITKIKPSTLKRLTK